MILARRPLSPSLFAGALVFLMTACGGESEPAPASAPAGAPAGAKAQGAEPVGAAKGAKGAASAQLAYQTALQLLMKGDPKKAAAEFERATTLDANMSEAFHELGKLLVHLSSQTVGSQARDLTILEKGIAALERARDLEPSNDQYWYWVGRARYIRDDLVGAAQGLAKAVELNPKHALAWKTLGRVQKVDGHTAEARTSFQKAIENDPTDARAFFQLGQTLEELKDLENARAAYEKAVALDPTEPEVFGRLLTVCAALGDSECEARARAGMESWTEYDRRLDLARRDVNQNPGDAKAMRRLGVMQVEVGRWEEALEWFMKAVIVDPRDAKTHLYCGIARRHLRDYVNATNHLKEAEFLAPDVLDPKLELLRLYAETEDAPGWKELLERTEGEAAADGASLYDLGTLCAELGRAEDAARLLEKARALGVTEPAAGATTEAVQGE